MGRHLLRRALLADARTGAGWPPLWRPATRQAGDVPEFYLGENEYAIVVLGVDQKPRILLIDKGPRKRFYFGLEGERCHTRAQAQYDVGMSQSKYGTRATVTIVSRD